MAKRALLLHTRTPAGASPQAARARAGWVLCLAVVLLWAQMGGWLHGLSHSMGAAVHPQAHAAHAAHAEHDDATQAHAEQVCETCLAFAALGGTAVLPRLHAAPDWAGLSHVLPGPRHGPKPWPSAFAAYRTRAPPG